jgi:hypothetical protein
MAGTIANPTNYAVYTLEDSWGNWLTSFDFSLRKDDAMTIYDPCSPTVFPYSAVWLARSKYMDHLDARTLHMDDTWLKQ